MSLSRRVGYALVPIVCSLIERGPLLVPEELLDRLAIKIARKIYELEKAERELDV